jgi:hypothetical protein
MQKKFQIFDKDSHPRKSITDSVIGKLLKVIRGLVSTKSYTSLQQVNDCDSGYDDGWNKYCHIGLAKHPDVAASCPISGPKTETESSFDLHA